MRPWLPAALLVLVALAGCAEDGSDDPDGTDGGDGGDGGSGGGNGTIDGQGPANNTAPTANLTADVLNGTAPLDVNLSLDGSDADGDELTWILEGAGEAANGTALPATLNLTLGAGNHTFVLTVSDGNLSSTANLTIVVVEAEAAPPEDPNAPQDRGWYVYDPATNLCHVKTYTSYGGVVYVSSLSGGTWVLAETNGESGLQVADNHPASSQNVGFQLDVPDCENGDLVLV